MAAWKEQEMLGGGVGAREATVYFACVCFVSGACEVGMGGGDGRWGCEVGMGG